MDAEQRGEYAGRIERCAFEGMKPGEANQYITTGDELAESRHPYTPPTVCEIHSRIPRREAKQFLWAINQIARSQAEKCDRKGNVGGHREFEDLGSHSRRSSEA